MKVTRLSDNQQSLFEVVEVQTAEVQLARQTTKSNAMIQTSKHDLSDKQIKIVDYLISKINRDDEGFDTVWTNINELNRVLKFGQGTANINSTKEAIKSLFGMTVTFVEDEGERTVSWLDEMFVYTTKVDDVAGKHKKNDVRLRLKPDLAPYVLNQRSHFTSYRLGEEVDIRGRYALLLFQLGKSAINAAGQNDGTGAVIFTVAEIMNYFLKKGTTYAWSNFNQRVLKTAVREVEHKTDMRIEIQTILNGREVVEVAIGFRTNSADAPVITAIEYDGMDNPEDQLRQLISVYPRVDANSEKNALIELVGLVNQGVKYEDILQGATNYAVVVKAPDFKSQFTHGLVRFLAEREFMAYLVTKPHRTRETAPKYPKSATSATADMKEKKQAVADRLHALRGHKESD
ncbi:RepB family plasmid replication initiator protein [Periweissella cryptocerci]|uniref:RepB family plasmid replication initiator protein n=1 Tax=Periweissella cryptocerci TaxID=2506420 RepID=A0A4P6YU37_9LACO|nr:replication initiation protein [Periweissella cryptocerci]QBO36232.1 RepB family plasmid replication initiator protein [Periweissella cryptocerci]